jgi:hypothetical protein
VLGGLAAVLTLVATGAVFLATPIPAAADLGDQPLITYNMQGATSGQDSKWTTTIGGYIQRTEVVALQEAGPTPPGDPVANIPLPAALGLPQVGNAGFVQHSRWRFGFASYEVYFLQTDQTGGTYVGGRVNTALVTQREADEVTAVGNAFGRPALGVRFGDTWYFSFHAQSLGGIANDSAFMVGEIDAFVAGRQQNERWVLMGDFNRDPNNLSHDIGNAFPIYAARDGNGNPLATQQGGHALDYMVASQAVNGVQVNRLGGASADHYAVALGALRGAAEPTIRYHSDRAVEGMQAGGVLDAFNQGTSNFTNIISFHRDGGSNQAWSLDFYNDNTVRFRGRGSNRCIDIRNSDTATAGRPLVLWDCSDQASQRWYPDAAGDSEVQLRSVLRPDLCMDVSGAPSVPDAGNVIVWPCQVAANERWLFTPADPSAESDLTSIDLSANYTNPITVEDMEAGGALDVFHARTGNGSAVISFHRDGGSNQGWTPVWSSGSVLSLRGVGSNRCLDIHNSNTTTAGRELVLFDCTGQLSQQWQAIQVNHEQYLLQSRLRPDLCMDVAGAPGTPDAGPFIVWNCTGTANQQFLFTSFDPTGTPERDRSEL